MSSVTSGWLLVEAVIIKTCAMLFTASPRDNGRLVASITGFTRLAIMESLERLARIDKIQICVKAFPALVFTH